MSEGSNWIEIVLLAMLAAFIGLRLISVLGKRTGQERPIGEPAPRSLPEITKPASRDTARPSRGLVALPAGTDQGMAPALQTLADADPDFEPAGFVAGARAAYAMILEAFWSGDLRSVDTLVSDEVQEQFASAIEARGGTRINGRLAGIEGVAITAAELVGQMAQITVRVAARIVMGNDPESSITDVWTFSRHLNSREPGWLLIATDDEPGPDSLPAQPA